MSKEQTIKTIKDRNTYIRKIHGRVDTNDIDVEAYIKESIDMSGQIDYYEGVVESNISLVLYYIYENPSSELLADIQKIERLIKTYELGKYSLLMLHKIYLIYYIEIVGDLQEALEHAKFALKLCEELNDTDMMMRYRSNLAVINIRLGLYENAVDLLVITLAYYKRNKDNLHLMYDYNNLGEVYYNLDKIDEALNMYQIALELATNVGELVIIHESSLGLSRICRKKKDYDKAFEYLELGRKYSTQSNNPRFECELTLEQAALLFEQTDYAQAYTLLLSQYETIHKVENKDTKQYYYELRSSIEEQLGDFKAALASYKKHSIYNNEIISIKGEKAISEVMQIEYKKSLARLDSLATIGRELSTLRNIDDVLFEVKKIISELMSVDSIGIGEVVEDKILYDNYIIDSTKITSTDVSINDTTSMAAWCVRNKQDIIINDMTYDYKLFVDQVVAICSTEDSQVKSLMYAPLIVKDVIIGVFTIQSYAKNAYQSEEVEIFRILTSYVAIAFNNISQSKVLEELSVRDSLTNLYNRRGFLDSYDSIVSTHPKPRNVSLLMLDLDLFKKINDRYGHLAGDQVLKKISHLLQSFESDTIIAGRLGGEEFAYIIINMSRDELSDFSERLRLAVQNLVIIYEDTAINISTSIGVSYCDTPSNTYYKTLYHEADTALYQAKSLGRNRVVHFESI